MHQAPPKQSSHTSHTAAHAAASVTFSPAMREAVEELRVRLNIPAEDVEDMLDAVARGEDVAEHFGYTPEICNAIEHAALAYYRSGRYFQAGQIFAWLTDMTGGKRSSGWRGLGACHQATRQFDSAAAFYRRAMACDPDDMLAQVYCGECLCQCGRSAEGMELLQQVLQAHSNGGAAQPHIVRARAIIASQAAAKPSPAASGPAATATAPAANADAGAAAAAASVTRRRHVDAALAARQQKRAGTASAPGAPPPSSNAPANPVGPQSTDAPRSRPQTAPRLDRNKTAVASDVAQVTPPTTHTPPSPAATAASGGTPAAADTAKAKAHTSAPYVGEADEGDDSDDSDDSDASYGLDAAVAKEDLAHVYDATMQKVMADPALRAQLDTIAQAVRNRTLTLREVADFSEEQMDAGYAVACQYLQQGNPTKALETAGWLLWLDARDARFYQLAGICMHHLKLWCLADYLYGEATLFSGPNPTTLVYHGEVKIMLDEKSEAKALLEQGVALATGAAGTRDIAKRGRFLLKSLQP